MSKIFRYSEVHKKYFMQYGEKLVVKKNVKVIDSDKENSLVYFLESGIVRVENSFKDGVVAVIGYLCSGVTFAQVGVLFGRTRKYNYIAEEKCVVYKISTDKFLELFDTYPDFCKDYLVMLRHNQLFLIDRSLCLAEKGIKAKLAHWLVLMCEYYCNEIDGKCAISVKLSQTTIARFLNVTRESINPLIQWFVSQGYISIENKIITVNNVEGLKKECKLL